jgi:integrase
MTAGFVDEKVLACVLERMMPINALALETSLETGLRITDVLELDSYALWFGKGNLIIHERKTQKKRSVALTEGLRRRLLDICGSEYVFPHRTKQGKHRARQTVYKDIKRACRLLAIDSQMISPHSMRKIYAVRLYKRTGSIKHVQEALNHASRYTTAVYAHSDVISPAPAGALN